MRMRASTTTAPCSSTISGLQSISATSGCASTMALDPQQRLLERRHVGPRRVPVAVEQGERRERSDHLGRVPVRQRRDPHGDVPEQLHAAPAGAAGDHRAEEPVVDHADQHLDAGRHHALDEEALDRVTGCGQVRGHLRGRRPHGRLVREPERDGACLGLVDDTGRDGLERDGPAQFVRARPAASAVSDETPVGAVGIP